MAYKRSKAQVLSITYTILIRAYCIKLSHFKQYKFSLLAQPGKMAMRTNLSENISFLLENIRWVNELVLSWKTQIVQEGKSKEKKKKAELTATTRY